MSIRRVPRRHALAAAAIASALTGLGIVAEIAAGAPTWIWRSLFVAALLGWGAAALCHVAPENEVKYRQIVTTAKEGVVTIGTDNAISVVNQQAADMLGYSVDEEVAQARSQYSEPSPPGVVGERETTLRRSDGTSISILLNESSLHDPNGRYTGRLGMLTDLSERKGLEDELAFRTFHDPLTALPNHLLLVDRLAAALARTSAGAPSVAVVLVDVDGMRDVNTVHGHDGGDRVLCELADRLTTALPELDTVARSGGDQFVVVAEGTGMLFAEALADRLRAASAGTFQVRDARFEVTTCMGVATGRRGDLPGTLLRGASAALKEAKCRGRGSTAFLTEALRAATSDRVDLASELRLAVDRDEFSLRFQPVVSLPEGRVVGAEALVRWERPGHGTVSPGHFISVAEETGLIDPIGQWVIEETARRFADWQRVMPSLAMSLNVSARQFTTGDLDDIVRDAVRTTGLDASGLALEITEAVLMDDVPLAVRTLTSLREVGITISIDDFGTGYSSLSRLNRFPVDALKIDQSFVTGLPDDAYDVALVRAVLSIGAALHLSVIAEGVETAEQAATLSDLGCGRAQGFRFFRPLTAEAFDAEVRHAVSASASLSRR